MALKYYQFVCVFTTAANIQWDADSYLIQFQFNNAGSFLFVHVFSLICLFLKSWLIISVLTTFISCFSLYYRGSLHSLQDIPTFILRECERSPLRQDILPFTHLNQTFPRPSPPPPPQILILVLAVSSLQYLRETSASFPCPSQSPYD